MRSKKLMATLLCATMVSSALAGCSKKNDAPEATTTAAETTQAAPEVKGEAIPDAKYYYSFDKSAGTAGIQVTKQELGGDTILSDAGKEVVYIPGVKGEAVYTDGVNGIKLTDINGVGETYTVSFWIYATRFADYMPTVQFGPDVHGDATGNQHYMNITRASWNPDGPAFPCVWSYDQAKDGLWPNWFPDEANEHLKEWMHIAITVDPSIMSIDGTKINAKLYVNGQLFAEEVPVVTGAMEASDNFDFLLGVNYWDKIFKGGFDELYVFDKVLTAGQVLTLYNDGNPSVAFEEPEHIFVVTPNEKATEVLGKTDLSIEYGKAISNGIQIADGDKIQVKLANWSDGADSKNNYSMLFTEGESKDPVKDAKAKVYADADGDGTFNYTWGNWNTWSQKVMKDADVTLTIERNGSELKIQADNVDYNESTNTMYATVDTKIDAAKNVYLYLTCQKSYVEILSVKNLTLKDTGAVVIGETDLTSDFWSAFSDIWAVPEGQSKTVKFTNYSGEANWNNFVVALSGTPTGHGVEENPDYVEYAVVRADNWGWTPAGDLTDANKEMLWTDDWPTWLANMNGAEVKVTVYNDGTTARVDYTATCPNGTVYEEKYKDLPISGPLYFSIGVDHSYAVFNTVEVVGETDLTSDFWSAFSDIWAVPEGQSETVKFINYSGEANWNNFVVALSGTPTGHGVEENPDYVEYAVVRADNWGWTPAGDLTDANKEMLWTDDWPTWLANMNGAKVEVTVYNDGTTARVDYVARCENGTVYTEKYKDLPISGPLYFSIGVDHSYVILNPVEVVGETDLTSDFWSAFSDIWEVAEGRSKEVEFTNYSGEANWNNFVVALSGTPTGHGVEENPDYVEYAVVRADNWGWTPAGDLTDANKEMLWTDDWPTWLENMNGAKVKVTVYNDGTTARVDYTATCPNGTVYEEKYKDLPISGPLYFSIGVDHSYIIY